MKRLAISFVLVLIMLVTQTVGAQSQVEPGQTVTVSGTDCVDGFGNRGNTFTFPNYWGTYVVTCDSGEYYEWLIIPPGQQSTPGEKPQQQQSTPGEQPQKPQQQQSETDESLVRFNDLQRPGCWITFNNPINARTGPGTNYGVLKTLNSSPLEIFILGQSENWIQFRSDDELIWIARWIVQFSEGCASEPQINVSKNVNGCRLTANMNAKFKSGTYLHDTLTVANPPMGATVTLLWVNLYGSHQAEIRLNPDCTLND